MTDAILAINTGSSSIKFSIFTYQKNLELLYKGEVERLTAIPIHFVAFYVPTRLTLLCALIAH